MASLPDPTKTLTGEGKRIYEDILKRREAKGIDHLGPYIPLLNHPELAQYIERLGFFYKFESKLPREIFQFIVLTLAKRSNVTFVWDDHIAAAREAGLPDTVIDLIKTGGTGLPPPYADVHQVTGNAFAYQSIPGPLQDRVIAQFGMHGLIEIVTLCGYYTLIGMVNSCFDVPLPHRGNH